MNELQIIQNGTLTAEAVEAIKQYENIKKRVESEYNAFKSSLLEAMEKHGVLQIKADGLTVSYVAPTEKETFDTKAFRADNPDLYDAFVKMSPVKSSIRIKAEF